MCNVQLHPEVSQWEEFDLTDGTSPTHTWWRAASLYFHLCMIKGNSCVTGNPRVKMIKFVSLSAHMLFLQKPVLNPMTKYLRNWNYTTEDMVWSPCKPTCIHLPRDCCLSRPDQLLCLLTVCKKCYHTTMGDAGYHKTEKMDSIVNHKYFILLNFNE